MVQFVLLYAYLLICQQLLLLIPRATQLPLPPSHNNLHMRLLLNSLVRSVPVLPADQPLPVCLAWNQEGRHHACALASSGVFSRQDAIQGAGTTGAVGNVPRNVGTGESLSNLVRAICRARPMVKCMQPCAPLSSPSAHSWSYPHQPHPPAFLSPPPLGTGAMRRLHSPPGLSAHCGRRHRHSRTADIHQAPEEPGRNLQQPGSRAVWA